MRAPPFRLTAYVEPEQTLHETVASLAYHLIMPPAEWACYPAGAIKLRGDQAAKLIRMGLKRGWPDFIVLHGKTYGMELKTQASGSELSKTRIARTPRGAPRILEGQEDVFPRLERAGMQPIVVCRSVGEVIAAWRQWGLPLRGEIHGQS